MPAPVHAASATGRPTTDANRLGLDYHVEAGAFGYAGPIVDIHTHVSSPDAARVYFRAARRYGVCKSWTMCGLPAAQELDRALSPDERRELEFIAVPNFVARDQPDTFTTQWLADLEGFQALGARIVKFWAAPRGLDFVGDLLRLDSPARLEGIQRAYDLGYRVFMTHVGDPDTWFATHYKDASKYGTKQDQFKPLSKLLDRYHDVTWIGAHMGGWPEDLDWLSAFLERHPNYVVDCSATKWQVRELSKHPAKLAAFCDRFRGRVLFGTDIVAGAGNVNPPSPDAPPVAGQAPGFNPDAGYGFDLYASRFWAMRTLLETRYDGPSPIVDPDFQLVDPDAPPKQTAQLVGANLSPDLLRSVYHDAAASVLEPHGGLFDGAPAPEPCGASA